MFNELYRILYDHYGDLKWWSSSSDDETVIGCILTQNTSWKNVEKSIINLKNNGLLNLNAIKNMDAEILKKYIMPSGFYNQKAVYLKNIADAVIDSYGTLDNMKNRDIKNISNFLKNIKGVGQETLDSIMLYALNYPVFVVDAYTKRFLKRYYNQNFTFDMIQNYALNDLKKDISMLKNLHAMIVELSKTYCKSTPQCSECFLRTGCKYHNSIKNSDR
ncbi:hypothetical protein SE19_03925 [Acidiplasma aeolicum]|uniref:HhH-GPD domain-containing protein n=1 Tax=Acidiplasma aeolicum TaxID=507754 RepID=A0A0P9CMN7_9ARCH|nr:hypothetical protein [Acidiplasma aeolicum]KPV46809.1 hypothetical protein SE19_03925 [Acidiplasma aeolicum]